MPIKQPKTVWKVFKICLINFFIRFGGKAIIKWRQQYMGNREQTHAYAWECHYRLSVNLRRGNWTGHTEISKGYMACNGAEGIIRAWISLFKSNVAGSFASLRWGAWPDEKRLRKHGWNLR